MKNLDTRNRRPDAAVDEILAELRAKEGRPAKSTDSELDRILAELKGGAPAPPPVHKAEAPPQARPKPAEEAARRAAVTEPAGAQAAQPQKPVAVVRETVEMEQRLETPNEIVVEKASFSETRRLPVLGDPENLAPIGPRAGKAAALEKVEQDKFVGDEELASWFNPEAPLHTSKREMKRAEKARRKQEKAEEKERRMAAVPEEEPLDELPQERPAVATPEDGGRALMEAFEEIQQTPDLPPRPGREEEALPEEGVSLFEFAQWSVEMEEEAPAPQPVEEPPAPAPKTEAPAEKSAGATRAFQAVREGTDVRAEAGKTQMFKAQAAVQAELGKTQAFVAASVAETVAAGSGAGAFAAQGPASTKQFDLEEEEVQRVPTAAYTQEFEKGGQPPEAPQAAKGPGQKNLFVDEMVDDKFRAFFGETVIVDQTLAEETPKPKLGRKNKKNRTALLTGEFAKLTEAAEEETDEDFDDYCNPQDAEQVEADLVSLRKTLTTRSVLSGVGALLLFWMAFGYTGVLPLPEFVSVAASPVMFAVFYLALIVGVIILNFTTVASGLIGLFGEPTVDSTSAIAAVAALLQGVVLLVQLLTGTAPDATLFGAIAALLLCFNSLGKKVRSTSILENFRLASGGLEHSAAYVLDGGQEVAYHITKGLTEENPSILISRPTALVKGFLRQSFSMRRSDRTGRVLGWVLLGASLLAAVIAYFTTRDIMQAITCLAAAACIGAPLSSTLLSGVPSRLLQMSSSKLGAVVPGWSAIEELGNVNVVMAGARDVFPPNTVFLKGIKTFEQERIDLAILYAASILVESCDTLRDIFMAVIQGKNEMLFKVENLMSETGRGFVGFVENSRVIIGTREMMQMHDIDPPSLELEMKFTADGSQPLYLAVSGKLFAMFLIAYAPDEGVRVTLDGLVQSGVSMLVTSEDPNVKSELIEAVYQLPKGVVKVMGRREMELLEPLRGYLPESEGVMTHLGTFSSFIGGMRAAAGCAASERMSAMVQAAGVGLACLLCLLLAISGGLGILSLSIVLLYQLGWTLLVSALPLARRY